MIVLIENKEKNRNNNLISNFKKSLKKEKRVGYCADIMLLIDFYINAYRLGRISTGPWSFTFQL
jgi:hypothetical protein